MKLIIMIAQGQNSILRALDCGNVSLCSVFYEIVGGIQPENTKTIL
jgi:hypothetical protein